MRRGSNNILFYTRYFCIKKHKIHVSDDTPMVFNVHKNNNHINIICILLLTLTHKNFQKFFPQNTVCITMRCVSQVIYYTCYIVECL